MSLTDRSIRSIALNQIVPSHVVFAQQTLIFVATTILYYCDMASSMPNPSALKGGEELGRTAAPPPRRPASQPIASLRPPTVWLCPPPPPCSSVILFFARFSLSYLSRLVVVARVAW